MLSKIRTLKKKKLSLLLPFDLNIFISLVNALLLLILSLYILFFI